MRGYKTETYFSSVNVNNRSEFRFGLSTICLRRRVSWHQLPPTKSVVAPVASDEECHGTSCLRRRVWSNETHQVTQDFLSTSWHVDSLQKPTLLPSPGFTSWWEYYGLYFRHKPTELAHSFYSVLVSVSVFMALSTVFHSINFPDISPLSHSVLLVLFLPYWSFQLYISLWKSPSPPL